MIMSTDSKPTAPKAPKHKDIEIEVVNPRYEGATIEMVVKAMLRRPKKAGEPSNKDDSKSGSEN